MAAVERVYSAKATCRRLRASFTRAIDDRTLRAWLRWHDGELPARVTRLEAQAAGPDAQVAIAAYSAELAVKPAPAARRRLVEDLDALTQTTERTFQSVIVGADLMIREIATAQGRPTPEPPPPERVRSMRGTLRAQVLTGFLFTYRSLTDEELARYVAFYRSGPCKQTTAAFGAAMTSMIEESSRALGKELAASLKKPR